MKIAVGNDHTALALKPELLRHLTALGHEVVDFGVHAEGPCDYPAVAEPVAQAVQTGRCDRGLLICGTGIGMMLAANKFKGIRAAVAADAFSVTMARRHNDLNVLTLGARVMGIELHKYLIDLFLIEPFDGGRHQNRLDMIRRFEEDNL